MWMTIAITGFTSLSLSIPSGDQVKSFECTSCFATHIYPFQMNKETRSFLNLVCYTFLISFLASFWLYLEAKWENLEVQLPLHSLNILLSSHIRGSFKWCYETLPTGLFHARDEWNFYLNRIIFFYIFGLCALVRCVCNWDVKKQK